MSRNTGKRKTSRKGKAVRNRKRTTRKLKVRRTYQQIFLDKLKNFVKDDEFVGNVTLRSELDWDEERYWRVREQLRQQDLIRVGGGKGGSVALAQKTRNKAVSVFVSYSHVDERLKVELLKHLEPLRRLELIDTWHDRKIPAGGDWTREIDNKIKTASIVLVLVSIDFINSKYCYDVELDAALERHGMGETIVVPVILRRCMWQHTPLGKIQALPTDGKAVTTWDDEDEALAAIADGVKRIAEQVRLPSE